jgi:hypothetical protein
VAARHIRAQEGEAFEVMVNHWIDVFLDELAEHTHINEGDVEALLRSEGVTADDVNALGGSVKEAGLGNLVQALGGWVLKSAWHMILGPFIGIRKFIASSKFRTEVKQSFKRALSHEVRSTKHMISVAGRLARGEEVNPHEKKAAMRQFVGLLVKVILLYFAGPQIAQYFSGGVLKALLLSPLDDILTALLDKPLRAAAHKLLTTEFA